MDSVVGPGGVASGDMVNIWFDSCDITQDIRDRLWSYIADEIDQILDKFYGRIQTSEFRSLIDNTDVPLLKHKQINHWRRLIEYPVDDDYENRLRNMHAYHLNVGLKNSQYIASYFFLMNLFQKAVLRHASGPREAYELIVALNSIISEDISRALSIEVIEL
ncbi:MAG: hypothetical protein C0606_13235 [Hyphomicrobiales bacterium]|nr:MAG: hypothetical protein C0606_13235 [Hyphomicrobiales bacterium]